MQSMLIHHWTGHGVYEDSASACWYRSYAATSTTVEYAVVLLSHTDASDMLHSTDAA